MSIVEADVFDHCAKQFHIGRDLSVFDIGADQVAQDAAEIFVARLGEEAARVGEHADEAAEQTER